MNGDGGNPGGRRGPKGTMRMIVPPPVPPPDEPTPVDPLRPTDFDDLRPALADTAPLGATTDPRESGDRSKDPLRTTQTSLPPADREAPRLHEGDVVRGFRVERELGTGGYGQVYVVVDPAGTKFALKILHPHYACRKDCVARALHEGKTLKELKDVAEVVRVESVFEEPALGPCIVMELLSGETLAQALTRTGRIPLMLGLAILERIAQTLAVVHDRGMIHRDLKPDNIFLEPRPGPAGVSVLTPVLLDFGMIKSAGGPQTSSSQVVIGTCQYTSPEQVSTGKVSIRSDVYAFHAMAYEILDGHRCFSEQELSQSSQTVRLGWHLYSPPQLPEHIPVRLWNELIAPGLEKRPEDRIANMRDVIRIIARFRDDLAAGRVPKEDLIPVCDAGDRARPAPSPLVQPAANKAAPLPDIPPQLVNLTQDVSTPSLLVVEGPAELIGHRYAIGRRVVIGRKIPNDEAPEATLTFAGGRISAKHCELEAALEGTTIGAYQLTDLSRNGTDLNGEPVKAVLCYPTNTISLGGDLELELCPPGRLAQEKAAAITDKARERRSQKLLLERHAAYLKEPTPTPGTPAAAAIVTPMLALERTVIGSVEPVGTRARGGRVLRQLTVAALITWALALVVLYCRHFGWWLR